MRPAVPGPGATPRIRSRAGMDDHDPHDPDDVPAADPPAARGPAKGQRRRPRHPVLVGAALLVLLAVLANAGVASIEQHLPLVRAGDEAEMVLKAKRIEEIAAVDPTLDVVFFGTSMMDSAVNPREFLGNSSRFDSAYNASVVGAPTATQVRWADEIVLDRLDPSTIVVGVHPIDLLLTDVFDLNIQASQSDVIFSTVERELRPGLPGAVDRWAYANLALVRQRGALRRPGVIADAAWETATGQDPKKFIPKRDEAFWSTHLTPMGESSLFLDKPFQITSVADQLKQNLVPDGFYLNDLESLLRVVRTHAEERGTDATIVMVIPPIPVDAWVQVGVDFAVLRQGQDLLARVAAEHGITLLDYTDRTYPNDLFADIVHMNDDGALRFSRELSLQLNELR